MKTARALAEFGREIGVIPGVVCNAQEQEGGEVSEGGGDLSTQ